MYKRTCTTMCVYVCVLYIYICMVHIRIRFIDVMYIYIYIINMIAGLKHKHGMIPNWLVFFMW